MRINLFFSVFVLVSFGTGQSQGQISPTVTTLQIDEGSVAVLHLSPGYATSVRLPEEASSVVIGSPAAFKAEHSEAEPRLVFFKPITSQPSESNALITTRSGHEISLHLVSAGKAAQNQRVDFLVEYRQAQSLLISADKQSFLVAETRPVDSAASISTQAIKPDLAARELTAQIALPMPSWLGKEILAALGGTIESDHQSIVGFSVLNQSHRVIEILPPQLELRGSTHGDKRIKAEPVPVSEFRMTARRLNPGERADGVVVFERPTFKESTEQLQLELTEAERVDRPLILPIPFIPAGVGGVQ